MYAPLYILAFFVLTIIVGTVVVYRYKKYKQEKKFIKGLENEVAAQVVTENDLKNCLTECHEYTNMFLAAYGIPKTELEVKSITFIEEGRTPSKI